MTDKQKKKIIETAWEVVGCAAAIALILMLWCITP